MTFMAVLPATPLWVGIILIAAGFVSLILTRGFRRLLASIVLVAGTFACFHSPTGAENAVHSSDTPTGDSQGAAARDGKIHIDSVPAGATVTCWHVRRTNRRKRC
jgi:hypothetical protein